MINAANLEKALCSTFCTSIIVNPVPCGFAVSTLFEDRSGDRIGFYVVQDADGFRIEDDGEYLPRLVASGINIQDGQRGALLSGILQSGKAHWDVDTYEIKTEGFSEAELPRRMTDFLSSLIRVRDLELLTREVVRSTFKEDAMAAIEERFGDVANFDENRPIAPGFSEFPSELNIRPKVGGKSAAVFFATNNSKIDEAVMLKQQAEILEAKGKAGADFDVVVMLETWESPQISKNRLQRAQNRSIVIPIFRGDENNAIDLIATRTGLALVSG